MLSTQLSFLTTGLLLASATAHAQGVIGQPSISGATLATRCTAANAQFNYSSRNGGTAGPTGIVVVPDGRIFVADDGGRRVLTWPNVDGMQTCQSADGVIGAGELAGPEAIAYDVRSRTLFVADTEDHTIKGFVKTIGGPINPTGGGWIRTVTLGASGQPGNGGNRFNFPRGLAFDSNGRLFVADDYNNRIVMFDPPFVNGQYAADSIGAGADGGFDHPKAVAMLGNTLFVADYNKNRVLRFTGPFNTPDQVYASSGAFNGIIQPVDIGIHPDGSLLVTEQGRQRVVRFQDAVWTNSTTTPSATYAGSLHAEPLGVAADRHGRIYVADYRAYRVIVLNVFVKGTPVSTTTSAAATRLLADLYARGDPPTQRVAIGQQLVCWAYGSRNDPNAWNGAWLKMQQNGLRLPQIMGGEMRDLVTHDDFYGNQDALNALIQHGSAGHIVTLVWHPDNPTWGDFSTPISTSDLASMSDRNTEVGQRWHTQLGWAAAVLRQFQSSGVAVMFRPLHEQNGTFFWWGHDGSSGADLRARQEAWVKMWRDMVQELTVRQGLTNLVFVFGTNQLNYDQVAPPLTYYPGGDWADVVSIDTYNNELNLAGDDRGYQHYIAMIGTGKPFGLSEFGQYFDDNGTGANAQAWDARTLTSRVRDTYPRTAFAIAWYSSFVNGQSYVFALPDVSFTRDLLQDPLIQTQ